MIIKKLILLGIIFFQILQVSAQNLKKLTIILSNLPQNNMANTNLFLAGDFNNWNPKNESHQFIKNKQSQLELTLSLPVSIINFKITKGSWEKVECNSNGEGINNRSIKLNKDTIIYLKVAAFTDQFKALTIKSTASKNVQILDSAFYIPQLGVKRRVWIYLPTSYQNKKLKFPVMYMHDGQNLFDKTTSGYGEWGVDEILDSISKATHKESIIVGIDHGGVDRLIEYNPYDSKFGKGKGNAYLDFIVNNLKPYIDEHYRTIKSKGSTGITGSSMGGLISFYAAIKYPKTFGVAGVFSPAFWIASQLYNEVENTSANKKTKFYFLAGDMESKDMVPNMKKIYDLLLIKGYPAENLKFVIKPDGQHSEWFWHREFPDFYNWLGINSF